MSTPPPTEGETPAPVRLFIIVVAIAVVLTLTIAYLGVSGKLGLGIPGEKPPPAKSGSGQVRPGPVGPVSVGVGHLTLGDPLTAGARGS